jgi:hypothetical protein
LDKGGPLALEQRRGPAAGHPQRTWPRGPAHPSTQPHPHLSVTWYVVLSFRPMITGVVPTVCFSTQLQCNAGGVPRGRAGRGGAGQGVGRLAAAGAVNTKAAPAASLAGRVGACCAVRARLRPPTSMNPACGAPCGGRPRPHKTPPAALHVGYHFEHVAALLLARRQEPGRCEWAEGAELVRRGPNHGRSSAEEGTKHRGRQWRGEEQTGEPPALGAWHGSPPHRPCPSPLESVLEGRP